MHPQGRLNRSPLVGVAPAQAVRLIGRTGKPARVFEGAFLDLNRNLVQVRRDRCPDAMEAAWKAVTAGKTAPCRMASAYS